MSEERCIHRHTIQTHPNCFKRGLIKYNWWEDKKIAFVDIESTGLDADFDIMLTYCIKPLGNKNILHSLITKDEIFSGEYDKRLVTEFVRDLRKFDIIMTYYGTGFDIPFVRARADYWKINFPGFGEMCHWDLYYHVKRLYKIHRRSLDSITKFLGINGKTHLDYDVWFKARYGDKKSLQEVLEHNKYDVIILEKLYERIKDYAKWIRRPM